MVRFNRPLNSFDFYIVNTFYLFMSPRIWSLFLRLYSRGVKQRASALRHLNLSWKHDVKQTNIFWGKKEHPENPITSTNSRSINQTNLSKAREAHLLDSDSDFFWATLFNPWDLLEFIMFAWPILAPSFPTPPGHRHLKEHTAIIQENSLHCTSHQEPWSDEQRKKTSERMKSWWNHIVVVCFDVQHNLKIWHHDSNNNTVNYIVSASYATCL